MNRLNKLTALAAAVALSGGLAACGGGGGSTDTAMMPTPQEMCADAGGRYNDDGSCTSATELQVEQLQAQIAMLRQTLGIDDTTDPNATIEQLQMDLEALQKQIKDMEDMEAAEAMKKAAADAEALFTGLDVDRAADGTTDAAGDGSADLVVTETAMAVTDTHGGSAAIAEETAGTAFLGPDSTGAVGAVKATETMVPMLGEWKGTELAGANDAGTTSSTVVVYTDVEPNTSMAFDAVYADATNADGDLTMGDAARTSDGTYVPLISATAFMHAGQKDHAPDASGTNTVVVRVDGTFQGAAGQYTCTAVLAEQCLSHEDDNGVRLTDGGQTSGAWEFVPGSNAMVSVPDGTYLYFGWWLHKDSTGPEADAFHGSTGSGLTALVNADFNALSGTATYSGSAAGKVAVDPVAPGTYAMGGHWTADANLTADFGDQAGGGMISGMIDGFMVNESAVDWTVKLGGASLTAAEPIATWTSPGDGVTAAGNNDVVWTIAGEAAPEAGMWSGTLYDQGDNNVPMAATGEFSAVYSEGGHNIGHMIGAFGAKLDE